MQCQLQDELAQFRPVVAVGLDEMACQIADDLAEQSHLDDVVLLPDDTQQSFLYSLLGVVG